MKKSNDHSKLLGVIRQKARDQTNEFKNNCLYLSTKRISVSELGKLLGKQVGEIIAFFWEKGFSITENQFLSNDLLEIFCRDNSLEIRKKSSLDFREIVQEYCKIFPESTQKVDRPPIVSIMGHVNHGKTTLLDTICQSKIQEKEVGGITQKITASQIECQGKKIIFLDTPGHSDFIELCRQGISLTDIAILVIDSKDGIMSQTIEIINYLQKYKLPTIVFINQRKMFRTNNETDLNLIRDQLQERGLNPFEWGGETIVIPGNAKEKESAEYLLENILLLTDFKASLGCPATGVVIDSYLYPQTGSQVIKLLIKCGELQEKDTIFLNGKFSRAKMLHNMNKTKITTARPGDLIQVTGLNILAELGDCFLVINDEKTKVLVEEELIGLFREEENKSISPSVSTNEKKNVNLILFADSRNSLGSLNHLIKNKISDNTNFSIIYETIGNLNNQIINIAKIEIKNTIVLEFGSRLKEKEIKTLQESGIKFYSSEIIYEIEKELDRIIYGYKKVEKSEEILGSLLVKVVFEFSGGNIAGCQVINGKINRNNQVRVLRGNEEIFTGSIKSLQVEKEKVNEVRKGQECGIVLENFDDFQERDKIIAFHLVKKNVN